MLEWLVFLLCSVASVCASASEFTRVQSVETPIDFRILDQNRILTFSEKWSGVEVHQTFAVLRAFAEKQLFGTAPGVLVPIQQSKILGLKSVFKVDQSFSKLSDERLKNPTIQNRLFSPIQFKNCTHLKCFAEQRVDAFHLHVDVQYQTYYRFLKIDHALALQKLGLSSGVFQNSTDFPKFVLIQVGKNWSNFFKDTVSVTFFEKYPQSDEMILVQSYQVLVLSLLSSIPQTLKVITATIQGQILGFIHRMEEL